MDYTPEQFDRLPKWAQSLIGVLQMDNTSLRRKLGGVEGEKSTIQWSHDHMAWYNLPEGSVLRVHQDAHSYLMVYVEEDSGRQELRVNGSDTITVSPRAANAIYVR
jgi:hypothetical protein